MGKRCKGKGALLLILLLGVFLPVFLLSCGGGSSSTSTASTVAGFSASPTTGPPTLTVDFTDESTGGPTSWSWDFGDGGASTEQSPSHDYVTGGTYTVLLTATGPGGSDPEQKVGYINVTPLAGFSATPATGPAPLTVVFTDTSTGGTITSWDWDFGDDGTSTAQNPPPHTYAEGTYTVSLTVTGPGGPNTNTKPGIITVGSVPPAPPVAGFSASPTTGPPTLTVAFIDESTGIISTYSWNFGDGGTSTLQDPSHPYVAGGTYNVSLTVTGPSGSDPETKTGYIKVTPLADFSATPLTGILPLTVAFTDLSTSDATSWAWDFGDNTTSILQDPENTYTAEGSYTVTLIATGPGGPDPEAKPNYITVGPIPPAPVAGFSGTPTDGAAPLTVAFTDESTGIISTWSWNFGDGGTSALQSPSHDYATSEIYTVALTATNPGGSDTLIETDYIAVTPLAEFSGAPDNGVAPLTVQFTDMSTGGATSWSWDFGDGNTSILQDPSNTYDNVSGGNYTVSLTATGLGGSNTNTKPNYISTLPTPAPVAEFSGTPTTGFVPLTVDFTDLSTGTVSSWFWEFGDGGTSTLQDPSHDYVASGIYPVALTVTGPGGFDPETKAGYITANPGVFTDDFTRADENPMGGNWTTAPGCSDMQIISNEVFAADNNVFNCAYWSANPFNDDQYSQITINPVERSKGPAVRMQTGGAQQNFYYAVIDNTTTISVRSNVNGAFATIGTPITVPLLQVGDTIRLSVTGNILTLFVNGGSEGTRTDVLNSHPSGVPGIWIFFLNRPLDDWEGGSL